jgi:signal transduction histidine kinase
LGPIECRIGMVLKRYFWLVCTAALILAYAVMSFSLRPGLALFAFGDITPFVLLCIATMVMLANAISNRGQVRVFWSLMAAGCVMWAVDLAVWILYEVVRRQEIPDPFIGDIVLFLHVVPFMAAVALRPQRPPEQHKLYSGTLNLLMLLVWWVLLYAFIVFPDEYVVMNVAVYSRNSDRLYLLENLVLLAVLSALVSTSSGAWKKIYANLLIASAIYTGGSWTMDAAIARGQYHTGSIYDIPFVTSICWLVWTGLLARDLKLAYQTTPAPNQRWQSLGPRSAMLAILSLPVMGFWAWFGDAGPQRLRQFRILITLAASLVLGCFVFIRQYLLDRELMRLLEESSQSVENLQRLHTQLVQKEKLASLGQLVAGAAHEINNPLAAILGYSDLLETKAALGSDQISMVQKIGQQARRTRDLVAGLLSFAQQTPGEKKLLDMGSLLSRALQMELLRLESRGIRVECKIAADLPRIWGNSHQLFQCSLAIIGNAMDALAEVGGGTLSLSARREGDDLLVEFSDSGTGIREPQRVFDPFYTTKPIGKGTGLGLSATYGVVQDHQGQITCQNRPQGGAVFILRFPAATKGAGGDALAARA